MKHPSDEELYDQLLGYLAAEGEILQDNGGVVIIEFDHRVLQQPLRLRLTSAAFGEHLRQEAPDAAPLYPNLEPVEAAWRLFLVHLDEAVQTARAGETELVAVPGGVVTRRADGTKTSLPREVKEYVALNEWHERLIQHYADRGEAVVDVHQEVLAMLTLDGRAFDPPLRLLITSDEMRHHLRMADDPAAAWSTIVDQIDRLAAIVDPRVDEIVLTRDGVITASPPPQGSAR